MEVVRRMFTGHVISRCGNDSWPPRSLDLSTCDFFGVDISSEVMRIEMFKKAMESFEVRL